MAIAVKRVLVTGGNRGIGLAIAKGLKQLGLDVTIGSRSMSDGEAAMAGTGIACVELDVSDARSIEAAVASAGPFDVLVNNAGVLFQEPMLARPDEFEQSMQVMVEGPYRLIRACAPHMTAQGYGRIVNVSSGWGAFAEGITAQGADTAIWLATLPEDGPTGGFFRNRKPIGW